MATAEQETFAAPGEGRPLERGQLDLVTIGGSQIGRLTLHPGWRWSDHIKPIAGTELCEAPHFQYHVQGTLHIVMADGTALAARPASPGAGRASPRPLGAPPQGSWAGSRSWSSTGGAPRTTPRTDRWCR